MNISRDRSGPTTSHPIVAAGTKLIRIGKLTLTPGDPRVIASARIIYLSRQELVLLHLLARQPGEVVSASVLAKSMARGRRKALTATGVAVYIHRLRTRLKSAGLMIRTLRGFGYVLEAMGHPLL